MAFISYANDDPILGGRSANLGWQRYAIDDEKVTCIHSEPTIEADLPRIHYEKYNGKPYRYLYATCFRQSISLLDAPPLYKVDTEHYTTKTWSLPGYFASEPVFLPNPDGQSEDDGVVISIITNHEHTDSFLLILDAITFTEKARAYAPHGIPQGLHGQFFDDDPTTGK